MLVHQGFRHGLCHQHHTDLRFSVSIKVTYHPPRALCGTGGNHTTWGHLGWRWLDSLRPRKACACKPRTCTEHSTCLPALLDADAALVAVGTIACGSLRALIEPSPVASVAAIIITQRSRPRQ